MRYRRIPSLIIWMVVGMSLQLMFTGCARRGPSGPSGAFDEWVQGKGISLMVKVKTVDGQELPGVDFDNQGEAGFPIAPLKCSAWYEGSGKLEMTWKEEDRGLAVEPRGKLTDFLTISLSPRKGDKLLKVVLKYGPAPDDEFTFVRK